jgi:hypothetical protein
MTRVALKADIGRLRSAWLVYDTDRHINQRYTYKTTTSWRSTTQVEKSWRKSDHKQGPYHFPF